MAGGKDRPGYDIVRETLEPILGEDEFDKKWNRVLHDGFLAGSELPEVAPALTAEPFAELGRLRRSLGGRRVPSPAPGDRVPRRPRRFTTAGSRTTGGCRSFPIRSPSSPGTTPRS